MTVDLRALVREIADFPQPGIGFKDITTVLADPAGLDAAVSGLARLAPPGVDVVIGAEARGFLLGPALARELGAGFVLARKPGKLPSDTVRAVTELARYGVGGRNLRAFRTSADREAALLQQILAPALRSRNAQRRKEAVEALENLAAIASHLKYLLLVRDLRNIAG